ncbi:MAG TPA: L,D-transpeptidase family protein [Gaiellaceae bacterium]
MIRRLGLMVLVVAALAPVLRGDAAPPVLVPRGVTLAGVPLGGMSDEQAQAALRPAFARPVTVFSGDRTWSILPSRFGGKSAISEGVAQALLAPEGAALDLTTSVDVDAVRSFVDVLDKRISYPAKDAELVGLENLVPRINEGQPGLQVLKALTTERIVHAMQAPSPRRARVAIRTVVPAKTLATFGPVIVIRRGVNQLRYYRGDQLVRTFGVATGRAIYPTPTGTFSVIDKQLNPWWRPPDSAWAKGLKPIPPGPGNPLGTRWMGLSAPGVGIHGTPDDASIGYSASHGCIRMHIPDAEWLFHHVEIGTQVVITDA